MKKTRIVVIALAILMLFAFVGCKNDKSEEMFQATADFFETVYAGSEISRNFMTDNSTIDFSKQKFGDEVPYIDSKTGSTCYQDNEITQFVKKNISEAYRKDTLKITTQKGIVTGIFKVEKDDKNKLAKRTYALNVEDVVIEFEYENTNGEKIEKRYSASAVLTGEGTITLSTAGEPEAMTAVVKYESLTLNGKKYKPITATITGTIADEPEITAATCNGKNANIDILNASGVINTLGDTF